MNMGPQTGVTEVLSESEALAGRLRAEVETLHQLLQVNERIERRDLACLQTKPAKLPVRNDGLNFDTPGDGQIILRRNRGVARKQTRFLYAQ